MRTVTEVRLDVIRSNFTRLIGQWEKWGLGQSQGVPMVKCNGYGHGLVETARALENLKSVVALGVATLDEGAALRGAGIKKPIWVFSECAHINDELVQRLEKFALTPFIHDLNDLKVILEPRYRRILHGVGLHLKFNTGMNRLGIAVEAASEARRLLESSGMRAQGLCSHLASSEEQSAPITRSQVKRFKAMVEVFDGHGASYIHCSNTHAVLGEKKLGLSKICNVMRPGIGIYGYGGKTGDTLGLKPALTWKAQVLSTRTLKRGERVGYGATYVARAGGAQAIIGVGYGDGLKRALSNHPLLISVGGRLQKTVLTGRVSMDLASINIRSKPGDWVTLLGEGRRQGEFMAEQAETVVYEILTSISTRVPRTHL